MCLTNNEVDVYYYRNYKKIYRTVVKAAKKMQNDRIFNNSSNKSKCVWNIINKNTNNKTNNSNAIHSVAVDNEVVTNQKIANTFNDFFVNITHHLTIKNNVDQKDYEFKQKKIYENIFVHPVSNTEMFKIILSLKKSGSLCLDHINSKILISAVNYLVYPLTFFI